MFNESLYASPSWASTPEYVREFLRSRFYPLEAQYLALRALNLAVVGTFRDYLMSNPTTLSGEDWRSLFGHVRDLAESVQNPGTCGPEAAAYKYPWLNVKLFVGLWTRFSYPACATQGVPRRANALNCNSSLRITATKAKLPGFPR